MTALALTLLSLVLAAPDDAVVRFEEARNLFLYQECSKAVPLLEGLLYPAAALAPEQELLAREYLGACHFWGGKQQAADLEFTALLLKKPGATLDPFYYPADMIRHFDDLKARIVAQGLVQDPNRPAPPPKVEPLVIERVREVRLHHRSRVPLFLPFGAPQFANDQPVAGTLFATGQGLALATNVGCYLAIELMRGPDGLLSDGNYERARTLQWVLYGGLGAFLGLWAWSLVDGLVRFPGDVVEEAPPALPGVGISPAGTPLFTTTFTLPLGSF